MPDAGEFDFTIVRIGWPMKVSTGGELADCPFASSRAWSTIGLGAPTGTVAVNVSGGDTSTLLDVAAGNVVGPLPVALLSLKVRRAGGGARRDGARPLVHDRVGVVRGRRRRRSSASAR